MVVFIFCFSSAPPNISLLPSLLALLSNTQASHQTTQVSSIPTVIHFSLTSKICFENGKTPSSSGPTLLGRYGGGGHFCLPSSRAFSELSFCCILCQSETQKLTGSQGNVRGIPFNLDILDVSTLYPGSSPLMLLRSQVWWQLCSYSRKRSPGPFCHSARLL